MRKKRNHTDMLAINQKGIEPGNEKHAHMWVVRLCALLEILAAFFINPISTYICQAYSPTTISYVYEDEADEVVEFYREALKNYDECVYVENVNSLFKKNQFKQTLQSSTYTYYGKIKDGRPNGMGVLFEDGVVCYMGNFEKGYFSGYGISYAYEKPDYIIQYEGEWSKGKQSGEGTSYYESTTSVDIKFKGEFKNGSPSGNVEHYDYDDDGTLYLRYEGSYKNGKASGKGKRYYSNGVLLYEGSFKKGLYSGKGKLYYLDGTLHYEGNFKKGEYNGKGKLYNTSGTLEYEGKFKN